MPPPIVILAAVLIGGLALGVQKVSHPIKCGTEKVFTLGRHHCAPKPSPSPEPVPSPTPEQK